MKAKLFIFGLLFTIAACANKTTTPPPQESILYQVESFFSQKPDSALQILDTLNLGTLSEKEYAHYCLLKVRARDLLFLYDSITDSLLKVAEDFYVGGNDKWFEAQTCEALSRIAFKEGKGEQIKLDWLLKAFQSIEQCRHIDKRFLYYFKNVESEQEWIDNYRYKIQLRLGMCYVYNGYYNEGLHYLKPVNAYFSEKQKYSGWFNSAFMLGDAYLALEEYDSCRLCFENGLEAAQKLGQVENIAYYHYSMSQLYRHQFENQYYKDEQEGQQLLQKAIRECHRGLALYEEPMFRYKDGLYCNLSKIHFQYEQYDSCVYYAEKQLDFMNTMRFEIVPNPENADIFQRLYKSYEALGNKAKSLEYADRYFEMLQTIESQPKAVEQVKSEFDKKLALMQLQHEQQVKRYLLYLFLALVLLSLTVVLWLSNRYRKNKEIEALLQEEAYRKLESEFEAVSRQSLQTLQQRVMELYKTGTNDRLAHIMSEFEASYPLAKERIKTTYPDLTESERNIVILTFLGFRTKEEAEILHLSLNTVEKYRTNIRKKAGSDAISQLIG